METRRIIELYLEKVKTKGNWQDMISADIMFKGALPPTTGKVAYLTGASRFFAMVETLEVTDLVTDGDKACAWVNYKLEKDGKKYNCLVSELLQVKNDQIISSTILFDSLALKAFTSPA